MLWEKEITSNIYIDLLENITYPKCEIRVHRRKNNIFSERLRLRGNQQFSDQNFGDAWNLYNEGVCFAENDSEELALSYANRSACFFKLKMYDRCLVDIQLAKDANYPDRLMTKLNARKKECIAQLQSLVEVQQVNNEPVLSFESDGNLPDMVNVQIESNEKYGRLLKAKCDISIGKTLIVEKEYLYNINCDLNVYCTNCGSNKMNLVPCSGCADATFCSMECAKNDFHNIECDMILGSDDICDGQSLTFILRSVITGINAFGTINEMMENVQNWLLDIGQNIINKTYETPKSKYQTFFKLSSIISTKRIFTSKKIAFFVFNCIMDSSKLSYKFQNIDEKRFLMHLIIHHDFIIRTNSFESINTEIRIQKLGLLTSLFNHSCLPNVTKLNKGNLSICKTILPVKQGEQLFVTYISGEVFDMTKEERNEFLQENYGFRCQCKLCIFGRLQAGNIDKDPSFVYVLSNILDDRFVEAKISSIIQECIKFLLKYQHMIGSKEVGYISEMLSVMFAKELKG